MKIWRADSARESRFTGNANYVNVSVWPRNASVDKLLAILVARKGKKREEEVLTTKRDGAQFFYEQ